MKKLSLLFTLALASLCTTGCSLEDFFNPKQETPSDEKEDDDKKEVKPQSIELRYDSTELMVGDSYDIEVSVLPEKANQSVEFRSDDESIATVDRDGTVIAESVGECSIFIESVEDVNVNASFEVSVLAPEESFDVTFDGNGSTSGSMPAVRTNGSTYVVPTCSFIRTNHHFKNWEAQVNGQWEEHLPGDTILNISGNIRFKAIWESDLVENYTVSFNGNGNSGGSMFDDYTQGSTYLVPACNFTKENYQFKGWALGSVQGDLYAKGATIFNIESNITLYAIWEEESSDPYYSGCEGLTGTALLNKLREINGKKRTSTVGYNSMGTDPSGEYKYTDYDPNYVQYDSKGQQYGTRILSFYSGNSTTSWNREHVWPKSHGGNLVDPDIHMPRPTIASENGSRGNSFYVEGKCDGTYGWDPAMEDFGVESYRGDSARIIFYCVVASSSLSLVELEYHQTSNNNRDNLMGKLSDMLKWNKNYPVLDREKRRNEGAEYLQGNRNPFIDHPEYACKIWGNENSETKKVCGM